MMFGKPILSALFVGLVAPLLAVAQPLKPFISTIADVANNSTGPIAPGGMVVLVGSGLGPSQSIDLQLDEKGRVANILADVQVLFDGIPAPLISVSGTKVAAMVPYAIGGNTTTRIQAVYHGIASDSFSKSVAATAPAIFKAHPSDSVQGAISNIDGSPNSLVNPAIPGSLVTFYITGYGQPDAPAFDGEIAARSIRLKVPISVMIAGRISQVLYAGSAPGFVSGFAQVTLLIPSDFAYGGNLPLVVRIGDTVSQSETTVAVAGPLAPIPDAPLAVMATATPTNQIRIGWQAADTLASRFHIERRQGSSSNPFSEIAVVVASTLEFIDPNVSPGNNYQYRIRAENDYGYSGYSTVISVSLLPFTLLPPSNFQAVAVNQTQVNLSWSTVNTNATTFQIERKTGGAGTYATLATVPSTAVSYQDSSVAATTTYVYRMRSQGLSGFSEYSNESTVTTPALPLPTAPVLQGTTTSASQIHLTWTSAAIGILRFRIERRTSASQYTEINQPSLSTRSFDDLGLTPSTNYLYRMRVETVAGLSGYSNEITATTMRGLPAGPTNLRATVTSPTQVNLSWANNAIDATSIRVESRPATASTFTDIGLAALLTSTGVNNLQQNTSYSFRVRAQNGAGFSPYSNEVTVTTQAVKTIFLIHGIGQGRADMQGLSGSLTGSSGIDLSRFRVDAGFDFSECASTSSCSSNCSISGGAQKMAQYIANANPPGDIVLVGFSMGGLIARDMMANSRLALNGKKVAALITLGTPNLGYPYTFPDTVFSCTPLVQQMDGNWRSQQATNAVVLSPYLLSLTNQWQSASYPGSTGLWLAASGRSCSESIRLLNPTTGCQDASPFSDGVVCNDSAVYKIRTASGTAPVTSWQDPGRIYVHSNGFLGLTGVLCPNSGNPTLNPPLSNPPSFGPLFAEMKGLLNGLQ